MQSVPITTNVSLNTTRARFTKENIMSEFVSDLSSTNKTDRHNITEILLKVALNTITQTPNPLHSNIETIIYMCQKNQIMCLWDTDG